jgi:hypothetical protein
VPLSRDLSISCCRVILDTFFVLGLFAGSVVVVVVGAAAGAVAVAAGAAAGGPAVIVSEPVFRVLWASTTPADRTRTRLRPSWQAKKASSCELQCCLTRNAARVIPPNYATQGGEIFRFDNFPWRAFARLK